MIQEAGAAPSRAAEVGPTEVGAGRGRDQRTALGGTIGACSAARAALKRGAAGRFSEWARPMRGAPRDDQEGTREGKGRQ
jgi:hypothetical protein